MLKVKDIIKGRTATTLMLVFIFLCLASIASVRCQPNSIEKDIEIDCKWKGAPVSANLKWTEPKEDPVKPNKDTGSISKSETTSSQASTSINTQQALMLTGASAGAALAGGGLLVKKKLEGSGSSSEQETKQTTSTSTINKDLLMQKQMNSQSSSLQSQPPTQTQQSSIQTPPKDNGLTPIASTLTASGATITKDLLMQKQMDSLTKQSVNSPSTQEGGTQQSKKETASSTPTTSQGTGLLASSYSAARIAAEMWPQRQKEFEQLAKQRADLTAKFSIPSYTGTGLSLAPSMTKATENAWTRLQDFGSSLGNGLTKAWDAIKPYSKYIVPIVTAAIVVASIFLIPPAAPAFAGAGMGISISQGAGLVGAGVLVGGITFYAVHNTIMNYPQQTGFGVEHTQIIGQPQTSEIKDEKGSGAYGEDVAHEQLDQADIAKDSIIQGDLHDGLMDDAEAWIKSKGQEVQSKDRAELDPETLELLQRYGLPDLISEDYIVECEKGTWDESQYGRALDQAMKYVNLIEYLAKKGVKKTLVYWFAKFPTDPDWQTVIDYLLSNGVTLMPDEIFGGG